MTLLLLILQTVSSLLFFFAKLVLEQLMHASSQDTSRYKQGRKPKKKK